MNERKKLIAWLFEKSQIIYTYYFKRNKPWGLTKSDLLKYPEGTFGNQLGMFLEANDFDLIPKVERHDAYHVLTGFSTKVEDEIAQQFLCFANGKRSPYLFGVIILGTFILPEYLNYYIKSYRIGQSANTFYNLDFNKLLDIPFKNLQSSIFTRSQINNLKTLYHA